MKYSQSPTCGLVLALAVFLSLCSSSKADTQTLSLADKKDVTFSHSPEMHFETTVDGDGITLKFQGVPNSPNWMRTNIPCTLTAPSAGSLEIEYRSEYPMNRYFAVDVITADNQQYSARLGSKEQGYRFSAMKSEASVPLAELKNKGGTPLPATAPIVQINLIMTSSPETEVSEVHFYEIRLESNDK